ncbi:hypothetical protein [Vagococcus intermedius]|uniref:Uncharacterized protein n=1 Tax=Vagococcus intermedius TaxID=2991418 RepID=A0AAF0I8A7_9ENTE|nr:hypothetical protein [Vagococcus intermedius]WEG74205.1 hypothetical protein OL234_04730 [Vagococcus intermedius]WEG76286.1 hypothetical protein OL235_04735 [Vagococcus intermedius]
MGIKSFFSRKKTLIGNQEMITKAINFIEMEENTSKTEILDFLKKEAMKEVNNNQLETFPKEQEFLELYTLVTTIYKK